MYQTQYRSPVGTYLLTSDGSSLTGVWLCGQRHFPSESMRFECRHDLPIFLESKAWLSSYFSKTSFPAPPPLAPVGSPFRQAVWSLLQKIPYGTTISYSALSRQLRALGIPASPQAVGGAVGHNPISIFIPCHRVVASDGTLTGYAGGLDVKRFLLELERTDRFDISDTTHKCITDK